MFSLDAAEAFSFIFVRPSSSLLQSFNYLNCFSSRRRQLSTDPSSFWCDYQFPNLCLRQNSFATSSSSCSCCSGRCRWLRRQLQFFRQSSPVRGIESDWKKIAIFFSSFWDFFFSTMSSDIKRICCLGAGYVGGPTWWEFFSFYWAVVIGRAPRKTN